MPCHWNIGSGTEDDRNLEKGGEFPGGGTVLPKPQWVNRSQPVRAFTSSEGGESNDAKHREGWSPGALPPAWIWMQEACCQPGLQCSQASHQSSHHPKPLLNLVSLEHQCLLRIKVSSSPPLHPHLTSGKWFLFSLSMTFPPASNGHKRWEICLPEGRVVLTLFLSLPLCLFFF